MECVYDQKINLFLNLFFTRGDFRLGQRSNNERLRKERVRAPAAVAAGLRHRAAVAVVVVVVVVVGGSWHWSRRPLACQVGSGHC